MKNQRRSDIAKCPVHMAIKDECIIKLKNFGAFSKETILKTTHMEAVSDSIRWDFLRDLIEDELKTKLLPVASRFFYQKSKAHNKEGWTVASNPGAFLASGWGKKTAGFVSVELKNGELVIKNFAHVKARANGLRQSAIELGNTAAAHGFFVDAKGETVALENPNL